MRKYTSEQFIADYEQKYSKKLILVEVNSGVAEFVTKEPDKYNLGLIDFDVLKDGRCPICLYDTVTIKINGKQKEYCLDCDFWFE